jgi:hypothetical protein
MERYRKRHTSEAFIYSTFHIHARKKRFYFGSREIFRKQVGSESRRLQKCMQFEEIKCDGQRKRTTNRNGFVRDVRCVVWLNAVFQHVFTSYFGEMKSGVGHMYRTAPSVRTVCYSVLKFFWIYLHIILSSNDLK